MANKYSSKNPYLFFSHPETVDVREVLPSKLQCRADDASYFLSILLFKTAHESVDEDGYARLNSRVLTQIMDNRSKRAVIECLIEHRIVECDNLYIPRKKSLGFRLHSRFGNDRVTVTKATDRRIIKQLEKFALKRLEEEQKLWLPVHYKLEKQQSRIAIDMDQANEILSRLEPSAPNAKNIEKVRRNTRLSQSYLCKNISNGTHSFHVGTTRRVFNCVTSLSRPLRPALRFGGEPLESIDIKNSQPALLAKLAKDNWSKENKSQNRNKDQRQGNQERDEQEGEKQEQENLYDVHLPPDLQRYFRETAEGTFYAGLHDMIQIEGRLIPLATVKKKFLTDVLAKKRWCLTNSGRRMKRDYASLIENVFRLSYPTIGEFILATNQEMFEDEFSDWNQHSNLIRMLQTAEAELVIEDAAVRALEHPSSPLVLTCHDAFFCGAGEAELITEILLQAARDQGYQISLKHDRFGDVG